MVTYLLIVTDLNVDFLAEKFRRRIVVNEKSAAGFSVPSWAVQLAKLRLHDVDSEIQKVRQFLANWVSNVGN